MGKWEMVRLGDISDLITKGTTPTTLGYSFQDAGINFIKIESIGETGELIPDKFQHISEECSQKLKRSILKENDILFSIAGALGRIAIVSAEILPANINQALAIIRISSEQVDLEYVTIALRSNYVFEQFQKQKQGVAQLNLSLKNIADITIPLPPMEVQRQIADVIDRASVLIEKRKAQIDKLDLLVKAQFIEMFGDPVTNPKGWEMIPLGEVATKIRSGLSRKLSSDDIGVPVIRSTNMINGQLDISDIKYWYLDDPQGADVPSYYLKDGDVLVNFINSNEHIGKVCIYKDMGRDCIYTTNIFVMNLNDQCNTTWFNQYAKTQAYKFRLNNIIQPAVNQSSFTTANYRKMLMLLPPISLQNQFATFVHRVEAQKSVLQQSLTKLEQNYKSLMQKCFRGDIF
ncbi:restriction endonuclease subunit S [Christensenella minuta]|uniref:restriction endonuclease subunit S n=1 Tax=Christensenella minuta TaxID=626937 RepID=UPI00215753CE|nr:restriction endonuclease subunit S [Christensenella minuta]